MTEHVKVFTGTAIFVNRLAQLLDDKGIASIIKDDKESGRLAGFGTTGDAVELLIFKSDQTKAASIIENFRKEISK